MSQFQKLVLVNNKEKVLHTIDVSSKVIENIINGDISTTVSAMINKEKKIFEISSINNYEVLVDGVSVSEILTLEVVE